MVAETLTKKLGLPEEMAPRMLSCLRKFDKDDLRAVLDLDYAELRCAVLEQHCSGTNSERSAAS